MKNRNKSIYWLTFLLALYTPYVLAKKLTEEQYRMQEMQRCLSASSIFSGFSDVGRAAYILSCKFSILDQPIYISQLSFIDAETKSAIAQTEASVLISRVMTELFEQISKFSRNIYWNKQGHMIANTESNTTKLIEIVFDPKLTPDEKTETIVNEIMMPNNVSIIISGMYIDRVDQSYIIFKPVIIFQAHRRIAVRTIRYDRDELFCPDPADSNKRILCKNAHEEVAKIIIEMIDDL